MEYIRARQGTRRTPARYQRITEEEMLNEGEYDDVWPVRPPNSTRRYQGLADVHTETGRAADAASQPSRRTHNSMLNERHTIPPRRTATQGYVPAIQAPPHSRVSIVDEDEPPRRTRAPGRVGARGGRRPHWLFFAGLAMLIMVLGWLALSAFGSWWQTTQDDWRYGRPRTFQIDAVVGHHDSQQNPSHFIAMNLHRHIVILEIPGGDVSKSIAYSGPMLLGPGQDLAPVTLTFQDVNHDGKPDMIVNVQGNQFVFFNQNGLFVGGNQSGNAPG